MLVITRRAGESLRIGNDIKIHILENKTHRRTSQIRIGIEAPKAVKILRSELVQEYEDRGNR